VRFVVSLSWRERSMQGRHGGVEAGENPSYGLALVCREERFGRRSQREGVVERRAPVFRFWRGAASSRGAVSRFRDATALPRSVAVLPRNTIVLLRGAVALLRCTASLFRGTAVLSLSTTALLQSTAVLFRDKSRKARGKASLPRNESGMIPDTTFLPLGKSCVFLG